VEEMPALLVALIVMMLTLVLGGVFSDSIAALVRRRIPSFSYEGATLLMTGLLILAAFATGLTIMYLLLRM